MSMRQPKCIRKSSKFLIPVGPFMDDWGTALGSSNLLSAQEKAEIIVAMFDGYERQDEAFGYCRGYGAMVKACESMDEVETWISFDVMNEINKSEFKKIAQIDRADFEQKYKDELDSFECELTGIKF